MYKCLYFHILNKKLKNDEIDLAFTISAGLHSSENIDYRTFFKPPNNYVVDTRIIGLQVSGLLYISLRSL